jgi:ribose transport system substrate-binding protein
MMQVQLAIIAAISLLSLAGCDKQSGDQTTASGPGSKAEKPKVALIMKSLANEFFLNMENGAKEHHKKNSDKYELIANGIKDEQDVAGQANLVEQMVARGVDAIVIAPADSKALVSACKKAQDAGITVVNIDNRLDAEVLAGKGVKIPFVGPDNRKGAKLVGEYLAGKLKSGDPVAIVEGAPNAFNAVQRKLGFEDAINSAGLKIVVSQTANWETAKANQVVSSLVTEHPEVKAFLCANDNMALGAVAALRAAGKNDQVLVAGFDNITAVQQLVKEGKIIATADQHAEELAIFGIEYALEMLDKKSTPADRETPVDLVTKEKLEGTSR